MPYIAGALMGVCFFIIPILAYREGIRIGMQVAKGNEPVKVKTPVKVVKEMKEDIEQSKAAKKFNSDLERMMSYTGDVDV
ncbi:MAG: hypothetical protein AB9836_06020 [Aminipila sp.]